MKKYFMLSVLFLLLGTFSNVQSKCYLTPNTLDNGVVVYGKISLCTYERSCLITSNGMKNWANSLEISYDGSDSMYGIHIKVGGDIINLAIKYTKSFEGGYIYEGLDRVTERKVIVSTKQKLSSYTKNYGVNSHTEVESSKGIIVTIPSTYTVFSIVPIKNK